MNARSRHLLALLALAACSPESRALVDDGYAALNSGRSAKARELFETALRELESEDALYVDARLGVIESMIADEPRASAQALLAFADEVPVKIGEKEIVYVSGKLVSARKFDEAIDLVAGSIGRAGGPTPALLAQLELIRKEAVNDTAVLNRLAGLGYLK